MTAPVQPQGPPQAPGGGMSYDEFKQALQSGMGSGDPNRQPQPEEQHPVRRFFDRLVNGEHGEGFTVDRALDMGRSAMRGAGNMVNETVQTLGEGEAAAFRKTGLGGDEFNKEYDEAGGARAYTQKKLASSDVPLQVPTDEWLGKRSDDLAAQFTEDTTQFLSSFALGDVAAAGKLGELRGAAGLVSRVARGAVTEGTAFDPHSGSLAGILAKIPFTPVRSIGEALMEKPGDSELVTRFKRAAVGALPSAMIDGLVEGIAHYHASKVLQEGATGAAKEAAEAQVAKSGKVLDEIAQGTYTPADAHVVARPQPDGSWILRAVRKLGEDDSAPVSARSAVKDAAIEAKTVKPQGAPLDPEALKETQPHFDTLKDPNATPEAKAEAQAKLDEFSDKGVIRPQVDFKRGDPLPKELEDFMFPESPVFKDRAEAEMQAETINNAMNERLQAARNSGGLTTEQGDEIRSTFKRLMTNPTEDDLKGLAEGTHFNFSYYNEPDQILSMIEGVSKVMKDEIDAAQKVGGVTVDQHLGMVRDLMGSVPKEAHPEFLTEALNNGSAVPRSVLMTAGDLVMREYAQKAVKLFDTIEQRPHDPIAMLEGQKAATTLVNLQEALAGQNSETGRALRFMQDRDTFAQRVGPNGLAGAEDAQVPAGAPPKPTGPETVAGMPTRQVKMLSPEESKVILRIARLANGDVNALYAVGKAGQVVREGGLLKGVLEVGINSMLSGVPTAATVHTMGTMTTLYNAVTKLIGSAAVGSPAGMREALDQLVANEKYVVDNLKVARMAGIEGRSVINPVDSHEVIGSHLAPNAPAPIQSALDVIGNTVRLPSKVLTASEEFTRVTNYRSDVYGKSLRYWREKGLQGPDLARQVEQDLSAAFTDNGVARLPGPLARADAATFRNPLQPGTLGNAINRLSNYNFVTKMIAPFVKTSINFMRWQSERTPALNMFIERSRNTLLGGDGPEAAAQLWTQSAVSGWLGYYAVTRAAAGELTGRGPSNPATRPLWLRDNKPYSIKIDGNWVSYNRGDPILQPLAIFSDAYQILHEVQDEPKYQGKASDMFFASVAGLAAALGDKTMMRQSTDFFEAWSGGKSDLLKKWAYGSGASLVPFSNLQRTTNNDPYLHEISSFQDELMSEIPGLSAKLPSKYDLFGNPMMKTLSVLPFKNNGPGEGDDVGPELMKLNKGFAPLARKQFMGLPIDLTDREKFNDGPQGLSPYERANQLIANPKRGKSLEDQMRELVKSRDWQNASPGSLDFPGGTRWLMAAGTVQGAQHEALGQVLNEYKSLQREVQLKSQEKGASIAKGQPGADRVLQKAGRK